MHLCVRGDAFTSVPTTIFQLDFVTFSTILHSLVGFFREVVFYSRIFTDNGQSYTNGSNSHENNKNISRNQFCLFCFCFDKCILLVLHYNFKSLKSC
jgi:hypothetical protein